MPIYEYECEHCGEITEVLRIGYAHMSEMCPRCNGPARRLPACANFKINGFNEANGYAKKGKNE